MNNGTVWFIEDKKTHQWWFDNRFERGWTSDPNKALSFPSITRLLDYALNTGVDGLCGPVKCPHCSSSSFNGWTATEHEFIENPTT